MTDITFVLQAILTVCAVLLTGMIIPWLNGRTTEQERENLLQWVRIAVQAAEQIYKSGNGTEKKKIVVEFLRNRGFTVSEAELDNAIEAAVLELHNTLNI